MMLINYVYEYANTKWSKIMEYSKKFDLNFSEYSFWLLCKLMKNSTRLYVALDYSLH